MLDNIYIYRWENTNLNNKNKDHAKKKNIVIWTIKIKKLESVQK